MTPMEVLLLVKLQARPSSSFSINFEHVNADWDWRE